MLAPRGWAVVAVAAAAVVAGRLLGTAELYVVGACLGLLAAGCVAYVRLAPFSLRATRSLHPPRVHAGAASRVELAVTNASDRRSPVLAARDPFDGGRRRARFLVAPLGPGETARAAYRLPAERRGLYDLGPLGISLADPFGLAVASSEAAPATSLTVYPHVDPVRALPPTRSSDPHSGVTSARSLSPSGGDFFALRPYAVGDDLRRVHWPSTARIGELMTRQEEVPWQERATVLVDLRRGAHTEGSFELAVSAAASVAVACAEAGSLVRLVGTGGVDLGPGSGRAHAEVLLEQLAVAAPGRDDMARVVEKLRRTGIGGALAVVTTAAAPGADLEALAALRSRFALVVVVLLERSAYEPGSRPLPSRAVPGQARVARVTAERPFPVAWDAALAHAAASA